MRLKFCLLFVLALASSGIFVEGADSQQIAYAPEEATLIKLIAEMYGEYDQFWTEVERISEAEQQSAYMHEHDPAKTYVPKLLDFEQRHEGSFVGLMALRKLIHLGGAYGDLESPAAQGRRDAVNRLSRYAGFEELPEILRYLDGSGSEPQTARYLRKLAEDGNATPRNREFAKLMLARCMLDMRDGREHAERRLEKIIEGDALAYPTERDQLTARLERLPDDLTLRAWQAEAGQILQALLVSGREYRQPAVQNVDPKYYLVKFDPERTKTMPRITEIAEGLLFKEGHLRMGKPAPDLDVRLLSGENWSLAKQRGKVVVIQFSFAGCGPCEEMYPGLRELQKSPDVATLGIMADEQRSMTERAVTEGKLTWNIHWDGWRGPIATRWAVIAFPTVYVIDRRGNIAGIDLREPELTKQVEELLR
ncbi:MAG: TlpA family protein disulfide reductase [Planctomycetota bacterium]|nr:TlpA family protein disulfide reductase [Planctomycetaceae bacterium]MDQ3330514.1 TlpA family protein disulfide reductase [Planctomycetota bacterium]